MVRFSLGLHHLRHLLQLKGGHHYLLRDLSFRSAWPTAHRGQCGPPEAAQHSVPLQLAQQVPQRKVLPIQYAWVLHKQLLDHGDSQLAHFFYDCW